MASCNSRQYNESNVVIDTPEQFKVADEEKLTGLNNTELGTLRGILGGTNVGNKYCAALHILNRGYKILGDSFAFDGHEIAVANKDFYNELIKPKGYLDHAGILASATAKTPAGKSGQLKYPVPGLLVRLIGMRQKDPINGPRTHLPPNCDAILAQSGSEWANAIGDWVESINSHSYLTNTAIGQYGGITEAIHYLSNAVGSFRQAMLDLYQGMQLAALQAQLFLNHCIGLLEEFITDQFLGKGSKTLIWLTVICLVLSAIQTLIDDIAFFGSLFDGSDNLYRILNIFQTVVNIGSEVINAIEHPITVGVAQYVFPKEALAFAKFINSIGELPEQFMGFLIQSFSFGGKGSSSALAIANAIIKHYCLGSQLGELEPVLDSFGTAVPSSKWNRSGTPQFKGPMSFYPKNVPYELLSKVNPNLFAFGKLRPDGTPEFTLSGLKNSFSSLIDPSGNYYFNKSAYDLGKAAGNANHFVKALKTSMVSKEYK